MSGSTAETKDTTAAAAAELFIDCSMQRPRLVPLVTGLAAVFSAHSPEREGANQDAAAILRFAQRSAVLVVADGVGGTRGGSNAARLAVESMRETLATHPSPEQGLRPAILNGIELAHERVLGLGTGAATTITVTEIRGDRMRPYHVGDSMVLVIGRRGKIKHQTLDHGPVGYALEAGMIDERTAMHHESRHVITNCVGGEGMRIEVGPVIRIAPLDTVLLATDGVSDNLYVREIVQGVRKGPLHRVASWLAEACRRRMAGDAPTRPSKADDATFILYRPRETSGRRSPST